MTRLIVKILTDEALHGKVREAGRNRRAWERRFGGLLYEASKRDLPTRMRFFDHSVTDITR